MLLMPHRLPSLAAMSELPRTGSTFKLILVLESTECLLLHISYQLACPDPRVRIHINQRNTPIRTSLLCLVLIRPPPLAALRSCGRGWLGQSCEYFLERLLAFMQFSPSQKLLDPC